MTIPANTRAETGGTRWLLSVSPSERCVLVRHFRKRVHINARHHLVSYATLRRGIAPWLRGVERRGEIRRPTMWRKYSAEENIRIMQEDCAKNFLENDFLKTTFLGG